MSSLTTGLEADLPSGLTDNRHVDQSERGEPEVGELPDSNVVECSLSGCSVEQTDFIYK